MSLERGSRDSHLACPLPTAQAVVFPYMPSSLHARLCDASLPPLTLAERLSALASVAAALAFLYEEQVVHGAVKAANVLLTKHGCVAGIGHVWRWRGETLIRCPLLPPAKRGWRTEALRASSAWLQPRRRPPPRLRPRRARPSPSCCA